MLLRLQKYDEAETLLVESFAATPPGGGGFETHTTLWTLAQYRLAADAPDEAARAILHSLSRACIDASARHPTHGDVLEGFARALDPVHARPLTERPILPAVTLLDDRAWAPSHQLDRRIFDLAICLERSDHAEQAERILRTHLTRVEARIPADAPRSAAVQTHLGRILADVRKHDESTSLLSDALPILRAATSTYDAEAMLARDILEGIDNARPATTTYPVIPSANRRLR